VIAWIKEQGLPPLRKNLVLGDSLEIAQKQLEEFQGITKQTEVMFYSLKREVNAEKYISFIYMLCAELHNASAVFWIRTFFPAFEQLFDDLYYFIPHLLFALSSAIENVRSAFWYFFRAYILLLNFSKKNKKQHYFELNNFFYCVKHFEHCATLSPVLLK